MEIAKAIPGGELWFTFDNGCLTVQTSLGEDYKAEDILPDAEY